MLFTVFVVPDKVQCEYQPNQMRNVATSPPNRTNSYRCESDLRLWFSRVFLKKRRQAEKQNTTDERWNSNILCGAGFSDCTPPLRQSDGSRSQLSSPPEPRRCRALVASRLSAQTDTGGHEGWWAVSSSINDLRGHPWKMKPSLNR